MAVAPMKMLTISGPEAELETVIGQCVVGKPFQAVSPLNMLKGQGLYAYEQRNPFSEPLNLAYRISEDLEIPLQEVACGSETRSCEAASAWLTQLHDSHAALLAERSRQQETIQNAERYIEQLSQFAELPEHLNALRQMKYMKFRFGRLPRAAYDGFALKAAGMDEVCVVPMRQTDDFQYFLYATPASREARVDSILKAEGFERIRFPETEGTPQEGIAASQASIAEAKTVITRLDDELAGLRESCQTEFLQWYTYTRYQYEIYEIRKLAVSTSDGFFILTGWVPAAEETNFEQALSAFPDVTASTDKAEEVRGASPPVLLKHNPLAKVFKPFISMYGLPAYNEYDPTMLMAVTYCVLFGIMYGDLGQGLVLIAFGAILYKARGMWLGRILSCVGVMACVFGIVFGSVFGNEEILPWGFHVLDSGDNAIRILLVSAVIGVVTIAFMMILNIRNGVRQHDKSKIFLTSNSLAGLIFYLGLIIGCVLLLLFDINLFNPVYIIVIIVLPLLVMFCKDPISKLLAGDPDWKPASIGSFIMENFFEMFETLLSYVTNTVSFLRVGAYAISHAGMMMVVYMLASNDAGGYNMLVLVLGNIFVMALEALLVCIQVLRLEFYEMFGRFYGSGGTEFTPSVIDYQQKVHNV